MIRFVRSPMGTYAKGAAVAMLGLGCAQAYAAETPAVHHTDCGALASAALPDAKIVSSESISAGPFSPGQPLPPSPVPGFCRVKATLKPSPDSDIQVEVWLPDDWNGKYLAIGIGGWGGVLPYGDMEDALRRGYATSGTDTGHRGGPVQGEFALGHPEKVKDFAWRAVHEMTLQSKNLVSAYYGKPSHRSYFTGCSAGGRQSLTEVQKFPSDFDGVIAGAAASDWVGLNTATLYTTVLNEPQGKPPILTPVQNELLHKAVVAQCDRLDGLKDGQVADPRRCHFTATSLVCKAGQPAEQCLTHEQAALADTYYRALRDPNTGALIQAGYMPGSESGWGAIPLKMHPGLGYFKDVVFSNPGWDPYKLNLGLDYEVAKRTDTISSTNPDLSDFAAHGGKLLQYHGWSDGLIPTETAINYYESVVSQQHGLDKTTAFYRLFLVPGMGHCFGAYQVDWVNALDQWVEQGKAPDQVIGKQLPANARPSMGGPPVLAAEDAPTRPICAYPQEAHFNGAGPSTSATNFSCRTEPRGPRAGDAPGTAKAAGLKP